jgi:hypothetical protein
MSRQYEKTFSKKQLTVIFKIAFLEAMALSLIMPSVTSSGEIPSTGGSDTQILERGTHTFTTVQDQQVYGPFAVVFDTPFPNSAIQIAFSQSSNPLVFTSGTSVISLLNIGGSGSTEGIWANMPVAQTEIFSPAAISLLCCRAFVSLVGLNQCTTVVDMIAQSNSATAVLSIQWATSNSGPWTTFANSGVALNGFVVNPRTSVTWNPSTGQAGMVYLRAIGINGGGGGDNPHFGSIEVSCTSSISGDTPSYSSPTSTGFNLFLTLAVPDPIGGNSVVIQWTAWECVGITSTVHC